MPSPRVTTADLAGLYDEDFCEWTRRRAELLRAGRFELADIEHIAEEKAVQPAIAETGLLESRFPAECPFTVEQILDPEFLP